MKRILTLSLLGLAVAAEAGDHRLAYSKAENVEVFVEYADGQPWCSSSLQLRFAFADASVDQAAVSRLLPKLGGLIGTQCAAATQLSWYSTNNAGQRLANGSATQADGWLAHIAAPATAPSAAPAAVHEPVVASTPAAAPEPAAPLETVSPSPSPVPVPAPVAASAPAVEVASAPAAEPEVIAAPALSPDFAVSGWQPPLQRDALAKVDFLTEVADQNGCRFRLGFELEDGVENIRSESQGVTCGPDGYAQGKGTLTLTRSDGMRLHSFTQGGFLAGLAVTGAVPNLPVVGFDNSKNLLLLLHSEPASKVHYLLRLGHS
jgi:hypothetical protein